MGLETNKVTYKNSWQLLRLKELCTRISDGTHFTPEYVNKGIPFISAKDIYNEKVNFEKCKHITKEAHQELIKRCFPEKDDILITKSGTIGRMALVPDKPEFSLFVSVALLKNRKDLIQSKFLKYCLENFLNHINIAQDIKGGLLKNFHLEDIRETLIPKVEIPEQVAIVSKIEELLSDLENGKQQLQTAQQQLKVYRQAVLKWAFEGRLTNEENEISIVPFGSIIKVVSGNTPKGLEYVSNKGEIQFYKVSDMNLEGNEVEMRTTKLHLTKSEIEKLKIKLYPKGTVIFPKRGGAILTNKKRILASESSFDLNLMGALPNEKVDGKYLFYWFQKLDLGKIYDGSNVPQINNKNIEPLDFPICKIEEQNQIVQEIETRLSVCDKLEETITHSLRQSEALRQSILKKAFEGKLVAQNLKDEPAAKLLEKITAESAKVR